MEDKKKIRLLCAAAVISLLLVFVAFSISNSNLPEQQNLSGTTSYPTPTPLPSPTWTSTPTPTPSPTPSPYPTSDPNAFSITQRNNVEYVYSYTNPTSYQPVIVDPYGSTHAVSIWGTYENWNYDVYVQIGSDAAFWTYVTSGVTDDTGAGAAYIPIFASNAGQVHNVVAVINPDGGVPTSYGGGFTAGELVSLVSAGTLRESNHLSFEVIDAGTGYL
jgi:hypothetical protein